MYNETVMPFQLVLDVQFVMIIEPSSTNLRQLNLPF